MQDEEHCGLPGPKTEGGERRAGPRKERKAYDKARGILRFTKLRVTDFLSSKESVLPYERPDSVEIKFCCGNVRSGKKEQWTEGGI